MVCPVGVVTQKKTARNFPDGPQTQKRKLLLAAQFILQRKA